MVEQHFCKVKVMGSNPFAGSIKILAGLAERSIAPDCKSGALVATVVRIHYPAPDFPQSRVVRLWKIIGAYEFEGAGPTGRARPEGELASET